jgi:hypothetical protein
VVLPGRGAGHRHPFYLAHPRLARLEMSQMLEVEGGTHEWCMSILRHETGHAIENAYRCARAAGARSCSALVEALSRLLHAQALQPELRAHLDAWYAQSHPDEDLAETFAVWLNPRSDWRRRYAGWPALRKLEYVERVHARIASAPAAGCACGARRRPCPRSRDAAAPLQRRRQHYGSSTPIPTTRPARVFSDAADHAEQPARRRLPVADPQECGGAFGAGRASVPYTIDQAVEAMIGRSRELGLRLAGSEEEARLSSRRCSPCRP